VSFRGGWWHVTSFRVAKNASRTVSASPSRHTDEWDFLVFHFRTWRGKPDAKRETTSPRTLLAHRGQTAARGLPTNARVGVVPTNAGRVAHEIVRGRWVRAARHRADPSRRAWAGTGAESHTVLRPGCRRIRRSDTGTGCLSPVGCEGNYTGCPRTPRHNRAGRHSAPDRSLPAGRSPCTGRTEIPAQRQGFPRCSKRVRSTPRPRPHPNA
jgi:hypothetical protein